MGVSSKTRSCGAEVWISYWGGDHRQRCPRWVHAPPKGLRAPRGVASAAVHAAPAGPHPPVPLRDREAGQRRPGSWKSLPLGVFLDFTGYNVPDKFFGQKKIRSCIFNILDHHACKAFACVMWMWMYVSWMWSKKNMACSSNTHRKLGFQPISQKHSCPLDP